jgi:hypothetical protein
MLIQHLRILVILLLILPLGTYATHPPVKEVKIKFYDPPATGYQVVLPLDVAAIEAGIRAHMAPHADEPMSFSNHLVYETIIYSPVTDAQEVTLHYQWLPKSDGMTELTLVALFGDEKSINVSQYPDMARVLLYDYSALVRNLSGKPLDFDALLDKAQASSEIAYQDTIRILKEGVYSYEQLLKEQQEFIDTLMAAIGKEDAKTIRNRTQNMPKTGRLAVVEDSLQLMRSRTLTQSQMMQRQKYLIDSLQKLMQNPDQVPIAAAKVETKQDDQADEAYVQKLPEPVSRQLFLNSRLQGVDSIAETYRGDVTLLSEQVIAQANRIKLLRRELSAREAAQREVTERLEVMTRVARATGVDPNLSSNRQKLNAFALQNQKLRQEIFTLEEKNEADKQTLEAQVQQLNLRLQATEEQHHETLSTLTKKLGDKEFENKTLQLRIESKDERIDLLSGRLANQEQGLTQAQARMRAAEDDAREGSYELTARVKQMEAQLKEASRTAETSEKRLELVTDQLADTRKALQQKSKVLDETEFALENEKTVAQGLVVARNRYKVEWEEAELTADSLLNLYQRERTRSQQLREMQDSLEGELSLINPYTESARARRRVYQQQLANITELQRRLPKLEQALYAWEKRLEQKEKYLTEMEKSGTYQTMAQRIAELEEEKRLLKERLDGNTTSILVVDEEFYTGDALRGKSVVSAFCLDTEASELGLRTRIADYFRDRKVATLSQYPLTFVPFLQKDISDLPIKLTFDISEQVSTGERRLACTVQFSDGSYLSPSGEEEAKRRAVQKLIREILE